MEGGDGDAGELGELRLQLGHLILGREAVDDLLTRFGLHPEYEARHDDGGPATEDGDGGRAIRVSANQLFRACPRGTLAFVVVVVVVELSISRTLANVHRYRAITTDN